MSAVAPKRKIECAAHLAHSLVAELRGAAADPVFRHGDDIVQVHGAGLLHTVLLADRDFGRHTTNGRRDWSNRDAREVPDRGTASQDQDGPSFVKRWEATEPDFTALYSSGHAVTLSNAVSSSRLTGWASYPS